MDVLDDDTLRSMQENSPQARRNKALKTARECCAALDQLIREPTDDALSEAERLELGRHIAGVAVNMRRAIMTAWWAETQCLPKPARSAPHD